LSPVPQPLIGSAPRWRREVFIACGSSIIVWWK
jgi:hypothetical protein